MQLAGLVATMAPSELDNTCTTAAPLPSGPRSSRVPKWADGGPAAGPAVWRRCRAGPAGQAMGGAPCRAPGSVFRMREVPARAGGCAGAVAARETLQLELFLATAYTSWHSHSQSSTLLSVNNTIYVVTVLSHHVLFPLFPPPLLKESLNLVQTRRTRDRRRALPESVRLRRLRRRVLARRSRPHCSRRRARTARRT